MKVTVIFGDSNYCDRASEILDELFLENPEYKKLEITYLDESKDANIVKNFDYMLAPAFFIGNKIAFCGYPTKSGIRNVLKRALSMK